MNFSFREIKDKKSLFILVGYFLFLAAGLFAFYSFNGQKEATTARETINSNEGSITIDVGLDNSNTTALIPTDIKQQISEKPPKLAENPKVSKLTQKTTSNPDGSETTVFSSGKAESADISKAANINVTIATPSDIIYDDQTGRYPLLGQVLKDYLKNTLRWGNEISSLKAIIAKEVDVKTTGWCGLYSGSYIKSTNGTVSSVTGIITINVSRDCYQSAPELMNDYMKLILAHEYGHHYTLYNKWANWKLLGDTRFPDEYYAMRQLDKSQVATDYSRGWSYCDSEIIAEDYSYFYSGYNHHSMASIWGNPPSVVRGWLDNMAKGPGTPVVDQPPMVKITAPADLSEVSGTIALSINASDDYGVANVIIYIDGAKVLTLNQAPYAATFDTTQITNGQHSIKAVASDGSRTAESIITITVNNPLRTTLDIEPPFVNFVSPSIDPFIWSGNDDLVIEITSSDDVGAVRMEMYVNEYLAFPKGGNTSKYDYKKVTFRWPASNVTPGDYILKAIVYDAAGNKGQKTITVRRVLNTNVNAVEVQANQELINSNT